MLGVLGLALVVRLAHVAASRDSPFFAPELLDEEYYHRWAERILRGEGVPGGVFYGLPLYPYVLALAYALTATSVAAVKVLQACLGTVSVLLVERIGTTLAGPAAGLAGAALAAVYGPLLFHETMLIPEALGVPLYAAGVFAVLRFLDGPSVRRGAIAGLACGLAALTKAGILLFVPAVVAALWWHPDLAARDPRGRPLLAFGTVCFAVLLPVAAHNAFVGGDRVFLTAHAGVNFYIGNNPDAVGTFQPPAGTGSSLEAQISDSRAVAETAAGRTLRPSEVSAYWAGRARAFIVEEPLAFLALSVRKLALVLDARELSDLQAYPPRYDSYLSAWWPDFRLLGPLVLVGLVLVVPSMRHGWIVWLFTATYLIGLVTFFVNARYRLPLLPVWLAVAGATILAAVEWCRRRAWKRLVPATGLVVLALVVGRLFLVPVDPARDAANAGAVFLGRGDTEAAQRELQAALAENPDSPDANLTMGVLLTRLGRGAEAESFYLRGVAARPDAVALNNLGSWYQSEGELARAEELFLQAVALRPAFSPAHNNLGILYARRGEHARAIAEFEAAVRADPRNCRAETNLGVVLGQLRRTEEARRHIERALTLDPNCAGAAQALDGL